MIDYVSPGQTIQANTINSLIANANYVGTPTTTYQFTTGPNGHVDFSTGPAPESGNYVGDSGQDFYFKASVNVLKKNSLPTWSFYLGLTSADCNDAINGYLGRPPAKALDEGTEISVLGLGYKFKSGAAKKLEDKDLSANGWLSTDHKWPDNKDVYLYQFYDKSDDSSKQESGAGTTTGGTVSSDEDKTLNIGLFLTDKTTFDQVKSDAKSLFDLSGEATEIGGIMVATTKELSGALSGTYALIQCAYPPFGSEQIRPLTDSESKSGKEVTQEDTKYSKTTSMQWSDDLDAYQLYNFDFKTTKETPYSGIPQGIVHYGGDSGYGGGGSNPVWVYPAEGLDKSLTPKGAFLWKKDPLSGDLSSGPTLEYGMLSINVVALGNSYLNALADEGNLSDISGDLSDIIGDLSDALRPKVDSEVSAAKSSSLEWQNELKDYRIWKFELSDNQVEELKSKAKEPVLLSDCQMFRTYDPSKMTLSVGKDQTVEREIGWKVDYTMNSQLLLETDASVSAYVSKPSSKSLQIDWKQADIDKNQGSEVRVASLYNFENAPENQVIPAKVEQASDLSNVTVQVPEAGKGDILWRKKDEATGKYELSYGQISVNIPFAQISADLSGLSSLSVYADSEKGDTNTLCATTDGMSKTLGLWNFSQGDSLAGESELDQESKLIKDGDSATVFLVKDGNSLGYTKVKLDLSAAQVSADVTLGQVKTIDNIGKEGETVFSLYNFEGNSGQAVLTADKDNQTVSDNGNAAVFLYKTADSNELKYGTLSIDLSAQISGLSSDLSADEKSIDKKDNVLELHNFSSMSQWSLWPNNKGYVAVQGGSKPASLVFVNGSGSSKEISYGILSVGQSNTKLSGDTTAPGYITKSIDTKDTGGRNYAIQLHNFGSAAANTLSVDKSGTVKTPGGSNAEVLYRDGGELKYGKITGISSTANISTDCDANAAAGSINWLAGSSGDHLLQLKDWANPNTAIFSFNLTADASQIKSWYNGGFIFKNLGTKPGSSDANTLVTRSSSGELQYGYQLIELPGAPQADSGTLIDGNPNCRSIDEYYTGYGAQFSLYGFQGGSGASQSIALDWGQEYKIFGENARILYREASGPNPVLAYGKLTLKMPEKPEGGNYDQEINEINEHITNLSGAVGDLSADVAAIKRRLGELSGDYWVQNGGSDTCYGSSIGNGSKKKIIDLDTCTLYDQFSSACLMWDNESIMSPLGSFREGSFQQLTATSTINAQNATCNLGQVNIPSGTLTLNGVTLTDSDLTKLLALIQ